MSLTRMQRYSVASMLATNTLRPTINRLIASCAELGTNNEPFVAFAKLIDKYFAKRDGFIPPAVVKMVNDNSLPF